MAARFKSQGKCRVCGRVFGKGAMTRHLRSCRAKAVQAASKKRRKARSFHIVVDSGPAYWMHLEAACDATLRDLDDLLREVWLECCGHMSDFEIEGVRHTASFETFDMGWEDEDEPSMDVRLDHVLREGLQFKHTYDYGTTTECRLRVVDEGESMVKKREIKILARNEAPDIRCSQCGKPATYVCAACIWEDTGWLCDDCLAGHECGDEMALPVVNSPRVGMCGYTGGVED